MNKFSFNNYVLKIDFVCLFIPHRSQMKRRSQTNWEKEKEIKLSEIKFCRFLCFNIQIFLSPLDSSFFSDFFIKEKFHKNYKKNREALNCHFSNKKILQFSEPKESILSFYFLEKKFPLKNIIFMIINSPKLSFIFFQGEFQ